MANRRSQKREGTLDTAIPRGDRLLSMRMGTAGRNSLAPTASSASALASQSPFASMASQRPFASMASSQLASVAEWDGHAEPFAESFEELQLRRSAAASQRPLASMASSQLASVAEWDETNGHAEPFEELASSQLASVAEWDETNGHAEPFEESFEELRLRRSAAAEALAHNTRIGLQLGKIEKTWQRVHRPKMKDSYSAPVYSSVSLEVLQQNPEQALLPVPRDRHHLSPSLTA